MLETMINMATDLANILKAATEPEPRWAIISRLELASKVCQAIKKQIDEEHQRLYQIEYGQQGERRVATNDRHAAGGETACLSQP